ncbi:hypothetical protein OUQ_0307 [Helicobacter pylori R055a]|nr:hypothetical protein OUQ_0307 [Helicobacter pylori R055a]
MFFTIKIKSLCKQAIVFHDALLGDFKKGGCRGMISKCPILL